MWRNCLSLFTCICCPLRTKRGSCVSRSWLCKSYLFESWRLITHYMFKVIWKCAGVLWIFILFFHAALLFQGRLTIVLFVCSFTCVVSNFRIDKYKIITKQVFTCHGILNDFLKLAFIGVSNKWLCSLSPFHSDWFNFGFQFVEVFRWCSGVVPLLCSCYRHLFSCERIVARLGIIVDLRSKAQEIFIKVFERKLLNGLICSGVRRGSGAQFLYLSLFSLIPRNARMLPKPKYFVLKEEFT